MADHPLLENTGEEHIPEITAAIVAGFEDTTAGTSGLDLQTWARWAMDDSNYYFSSTLARKNIIVHPAFISEETTFMKDTFANPLTIIICLPDAEKIDNITCHEHSLNYTILFVYSGGKKDRLDHVQWFAEYGITVLHDVSMGLKRAANDTSLEFYHDPENVNLHIARVNYRADRRMSA